MEHELFSYLVALFFIIILFLIFREIVCWYWKINQHLENQRTIISKLDQLLGQKEGSKNNPERQ